MAGAGRGCGYKMSETEVLTVRDSFPSSERARGPRMSSPVAVRQELHPLASVRTEERPLLSHVCVPGKSRETLPGQGASCVVLKHK